MIDNLSIESQIRYNSVAATDEKERKAKRSQAIASDICGRSGPKKGSLPGLDAILVSHRQTSDIILLMFDSSDSSYRVSR